ncbi:putative metal-dependent hydrolase YcfH [Andreprevotia sp. IGB-42]|uniref:TatD family hydrolase n=1 Tax=Andreprevotia sp. IGB-42 TaxID=2497473 RepID=UPI00135A41A8|nr:TatD family hydrolase [Andreprevotia sp. IGB-42]KAF0811645.1 putative metal-dependent hydrolase YcfH [Andreprevotia sp. IGB-42]
MFVDSHCHINFPDLVADLDGKLAAMQENKVTHALVVSVNQPDYPSVLALADAQSNLFASVGVHPDYEDTIEPTVAWLVAEAQHPKVIAIGETGLDYYRLEGDLEWQRERFRVHIRAAQQTGLPLIIHTRSASEDTIRILHEEGQGKVNGVMHCFTESWQVAQQAMALGFYISFSGIVTFKKAEALKEVAKLVPLERMLIETDSPYLAPMPFRGKTNQPAWVKHVAEHIADLRGISVAEVAEATTHNFFTLFAKAGPRPAGPL